MSTLSVGTIQSNTSAPPVIQNSSGTEIGTFCRAWVNFNGTGTVAIRAAFNVSSITDNNVGDYTVNFATAMLDANYSAVGSNNGDNTTFITDFGTSFRSLNTGSVRVSTGNETNTAADVNGVYVAIFR